MGALRIEEPEVVGEVGLKPEACLQVRLEFDEAGFVASVKPEARITFYGSHNMPSDREALENRVFRPTALRHYDIRIQDA